MHILVLHTFIWSLSPLTVVQASMHLLYQLAYVNCTHTHIHTNKMVLQKRRSHVYDNYMVGNTHVVGSPHWKKITFGHI